MKLVHRTHGPEIDLGKVRYWTGLENPWQCDGMGVRSCKRPARHFVVLCFSSESDDCHLGSFCNRCIDDILGPEGDRDWLGSRIAYSISKDEILAMLVLAS